MHEVAGNPFGDMEIQIFSWVVTGLPAGCRSFDETNWLEEPELPLTLFGPWRYPLLGFVWDGPIGRASGRIWSFDETKWFGMLTRGGCGRASWAVTLADRQAGDRASGAIWNF